MDISEDSKILVHLFLKKGLSGDSYDDSFLLENDCIVIAREKNHVAVYVPINNISKILGSLTDIVLIKPAKRWKPLSIQSTSDLGKKKLFFCLG